MNRTLAAFLISLATLATATAQETTYQPQDAEHLQNCFETIGDINADPEGSRTANDRECIGVASSACQDEDPFNETTSGMAMCDQRETMWWDEMLNHNYAILKDALSAEEFDHLREAQRAWLAYREAECGFQYFYWRDGTIARIFVSSCHLHMTAERALDLGEVISWMHM